MSRIAAVLIILSLAACGLKGSLERPAGPAPEPLLGGKPAGKDGSTLPTRTPVQQ